MSLIDDLIASSSAGLAEKANALQSVSARTSAPLSRIAARWSKSPGSQSATQVPARVILA